MPIYYRIGQVANMLGVSASALRRWEASGLFTAARTNGRYRMYDRATVAELKRICHLRTVKRVNVAGIRQITEGTEPVNRSGGDAQRPAAAAIGERLGAARRAHGLTVAQVAAATSLSPSFVSAVEGGAGASMSTLHRLTGLYRTTILALCGIDGESRRLVRSKERRVVRTEPGLQMDLLTCGAHQMKPYLFRLAPRTTSGGAYKHDGEEFLFLLQGKLEIWLDEIERYVLEPGDSLYFPSALAHRWRSLGERETILLWICRQ